MVKFIISLIALVFLLACYCAFCMFVAMLVNKACDIIREKWVKRKREK